MDVYLLSQLANGLIFGLLYALIALGLAIVFSIMRVVNFAHGELYMVGGYLLYFLTKPAGLPAIVSLPFCMVATCIPGLLMERLLLRPVYTTPLERAEEYAIIMTFGVSLFLQNIALWGIGPYELTPASFWKGSQKVIGDLYLAGDRLFAAAMAAILLGATLLLVYRTWLGHGLRATAQSRVGAAVVGIDVVRMNVCAMGLSAMLAAAAGALIAPMFLVYPDVGAVPVVKAYVVIVLGGMGSIPGSIIGAVLLGLVESLGSAYLAVSYRDVYAFLVLILVLLVRPHGLFGERERRA